MDFLIDRKSIYKITNLLNGKSYIGQSCHPIIRFKQHCQPSCQAESLIHRAIQKYGKENFSLKILEDNIENYNDREKYWIQYFNTLAPYGYNICEGGEYRPEVLYGENSNLSLYTNEQFHSVLRDLINFQKDKENFDIIAERNKVSIEYVHKVNLGCARVEQKTDKHIYPIIEIYHKIDSNMLTCILSDLRETNLTQKEISKKYNVSSAMISGINTGKLYYNKNEIYPIRKKRIKHRWGYYD